MTELASFDIGRDKDGYPLFPGNAVVVGGVTKRVASAGYKKVNKIYQLTIAGDTGDKFKLAWDNGTASADIAYNANAAAVGAALRLVAPSDPGKQSVKISTAPGSDDIDLYFEGLGDYAGNDDFTLTLTSTGMVSMDAVATLAVHQHGSTSKKIVTEDGTEYDESEVTLV